MAQVVSRRTQFDPVECNIVVLGAGGVGKSALVLQLITGQFRQQYDATIEDRYRKVVLVDGQPAILHILDISGQEQFLRLLDPWIISGDAFLLVYSIDSCESLDHMIQLHKLIKKIKGRKAPIVLCGNKSDRHLQREVSTKEAQVLAEKLKASYIETSAKNRINVDQCFWEVAQKAYIERRREATLQSRVKTSCTIL